MSKQRPIEDPVSGTYFEILIDDVLRLVLEKVTSKQDLVSLCLVSRRLYIHTVPQLYRDRNLDLSRSTDRRLLRWLAQPTSLLPSLIRVLNVKTSTKEPSRAPLDLCTVFLNLSNLQRVTWHGLPVLPCTILDTLSSRFPTAQVLVKTIKDSTNSVPLAELSHSRILQHPAGSLLTYFRYSQEDPNQLDENFKIDLVNMLTLNRVLKTLWIALPSGLSVEHPEMLGLDRARSLPKLQELHLYTQNIQLFTNREPMYWGSTLGGCNKLAYLSPGHIPQLFPFLGRTSKLNKLRLAPRFYNDMYLLDAYLAPQEMSSAFASLKELHFCPHARNSLPHQRHVVLFGLLRRTTLLSISDISRQRFTSRVHTLSRYMPITAEIREIRQCCPNLTEVRLNIGLVGKWAEWPYEILTELAGFEKPLQLALFLTREDSMRGRLAIHWMNYPHAVRYIRNERERQHLPWEKSFSVGFRAIRSWEEMQPSWNSCEFVTE
jgi:hypothetical protein